MATTTAEPPAKKPAKRKAASRPAGEPKTPRIPPYVNGDPFNEKSRVALTREQFEGKTDLMLEMLREQAVLNSEYEAAKADFKARIKSKAEDIAKVQAVMAARAEEQDVAVYFRYWPKRKIKQKYDARTNKPVASVKAVPMTSDDEKKLAQPDLIKVPANQVADPSSTPEASGHISESVPGALEELGVPQEGGKLGPRRPNPQTVEGVTIEGGGDEQQPAGGDDEVNFTEDEPMTRIPDEQNTTDANEDGADTDDGDIPDHLQD